jgi:hypothetical protein
MERMMSIAYAYPVISWHSYESVLRNGEADLLLVTMWQHEERRGAVGTAQVTIKDL